MSVECFGVMSGLLSGIGIAHLYQECMRTIREIRFIRERTRRVVQRNEELTEIIRRFTESGVNR